jgi:7-cyano-7-deazaguanine tRNA-ribosyltransferase
MFEIKYRDAMGRIGLLEARGRRIETPALLPVVNPRIQQITPREIADIGYEGLITNAYIIHRDENLRRRALEEGLHEMLDFDGLVMTDSGSYQLYGYGDVDVDPLEIVEFQDTIGSDIGVILDIPTPPDLERAKVEEDLSETIRRARASSALARRMLLAGTVQGSLHLDLREKAAREMAKIDFDIYPIGGVVPLMENYRFTDLVKVVMACKKHLPLNKPVHLFGCGHPMMFALACAMGCDIFDSAAYSLYAKNDRYITPSGTWRLGELRELPCSCRICSSYTPRELRESGEEKETLLAKHNLYASIREIKRVKQSIHEGSLLELVERRSRGHPYLLDALRIFFNTPLLDKFDPLTKRSAFFYSGCESLLRPEVTRHHPRLRRLNTEGRTLVLLPETTKPFSKALGINGSEEYHVAVLSRVFGIIPVEVDEIYPLNQHEAPSSLQGCQKRFMVRMARQYSRNFKRVLLHSSLKGLRLEGEYFDDISELDIVDDLASKAMAMADYQFGGEAGELLFKGVKIEKSRTGRLRRAVQGEDLIAVFRASDGFIIPTIRGAERLLKLPFPENRVVLANDAVEFVEEGRSAFAKFVEDCDQEIRPYQEIILVDKKDRLLGTGKALLSGPEMLAFDRGVAVKTRHHV